MMEMLVEACNYPESVAGAGGWRGCGRSLRESPSQLIIDADDAFSIQLTSRRRLFHAGFIRALLYNCFSQELA
jgi:hypothetical protein